MEVSAEADQFDILIVDDVRDNIRLLSDFLVKQGHNVRKAMTGGMALTAIKALAPDLILLDIKMADMSGYEICSALKADPATCTIPVIFLTAADELADKAKAFEVGGIDYITKPFHLDEVLTKVQTQLTIFQLRQKLQEREAQLQQALNQLRALKQP
jgi:PleD family two-component response regulator